MVVKDAMIHTFSNISERTSQDKNGKNISNRKGAKTVHFLHYNNLHRSQNYPNLNYIFQLTVSAVYITNAKSLTDNPFAADYNVQKNLKKFYRYFSSALFSSPFSSAVNNFRRI
jgi:hypothetical protein